MLGWGRKRERFATADVSFGMKLGGIGFLAAGVTLVNKDHPIATGFLAVLLLVGGLFLTTIATVRPEGNVLRYRRFLFTPWQSIAYSEIRECGSDWVLGYLKLRRFAFPWGRLYFFRPFAPFSGHSTLGWDNELIELISARAGLKEK